MNTGIGDLFKRYRQENSLTQEELSKKCGVYTAGFISHIEYGYELPSIKSILKFCKALEIGPQPFVDALNYDKLMNHGRHR